MVALPNVNYFDIMEEAIRFSNTHGQCNEAELRLALGNYAVESFLSFTHKTCLKLENVTNFQPGPFLNYPIALTLYCLGHLAVVSHRRTATLANCSLTSYSNNLGPNGPLYTDRLVQITRTAKDAKASTATMANSSLTSYGSILGPNGPLYLDRLELSIRTAKDANASTATIANSSLTSYGSILGPNGPLYLDGSVQSGRAMANVKALTAALASSVPTSYSTILGPNGPLYTSVASQRVDDKNLSAGLAGPFVTSYSNMLGPNGPLYGNRHYRWRRSLLLAGCLGPVPSSYNNLLGPNGPLYVDLEAIKTIVKMLERREARWDELADCAPAGPSQSSHAALLGPNGPLYIPDYNIAEICSLLQPDVGGPRIQKLIALIRNLPGYLTAFRVEEDRKAAKYWIHHLRRHLIEDLGVPSDMLPES
jgi:hypothetical protein